MLTLAMSATLISGIGSTANLQVEVFCTVEFTSLTTSIAGDVLFLDACVLYFVVSAICMQSAFSPALFF